MCWLQNQPGTPWSQDLVSQLRCLLTLAPFSGTYSWGRQTLSNSRLMFCQLSNPSGKEENPSPHSLSNKSQVWVSLARLWPSAHPWASPSSWGAWVSVSGVGWSAPKPHGLMVGRGGSSEYSYWKGEMDARQVKQQVVPTKAREREVVSRVSCLEETEPVG